MACSRIWLGLAKASSRPKQRSTLHIRYLRPLTDPSQALYTRRFGTSTVRANTPGSLSPDYEHFYKYTAGRWLFNEEQQTSRRYVRFDVEALKEIASRAIGANSCVAMDRLDEGAHNRVFLLTFDDGTKAVARIPFSTAGPPHLTTASEVATMDYARNILSLPVPKVLAWSSRASGTPVGCEFIIMEYVEGVPLADRVPEHNDGELANCAEAIAKMLRRFCTVRFSQIGCIYYKEDVTEELQARPLYAKGSSHGLGGEDRFRIGPSVRREFWRGSRRELDVDRGPWNNLRAYAVAIARCQQAWLKAYAVPRPVGDPFRRTDMEESPEAICRLIDLYVELLPLIIPKEKRVLSSVLWHPDLSRSNIMISSEVHGEEKEYSITGIIDWQSTCCAPLVLQAHFPRAFAYTGSGFELPQDIALPPLPENFNDMDPESQEACKREWKDAILHKWLEMLMMNDHLFHAATEHPRKNALDILVYNVTYTWSIGSIWFAQALRDLELDEREASPELTLPIIIPEDDVSRHRAQMSKAALHRYNRNLIQEQLEIQGDGWVQNEAYDAVRKRLAWIRENEWPQSAEEKIGPWPFQDGAPLMDD